MDLEHNYKGIYRILHESSVIMLNEVLKPTDGTFTYANGDKYTGQFLNGKKHGYGTYIFEKDQTIMVGTWNEGKMEHGKWILPTGAYWVGAFKYNKPAGKGIWVFERANCQLTGEFKQKLEEIDPADIPQAEEGEEPIPIPDPKVLGVEFIPGQPTSVHG